jgi:hypothetical protein
MAKTMARRVIMLRENPNIFKNKKEPMSEMGIVINGMIVAFKFLKKRKTIMRTKRMASNIEDLTFLRECLTKSA